MTGIWTCPKCRASNVSHRPSCSLCGSTRPGHAASTPTAPAKAGAPPPRPPGKDAPHAKAAAPHAKAPAAPSAPASRPAPPPERSSAPAHATSPVGDAPPSSRAPATPRAPSEPSRPTPPPPGIEPRCPVCHFALAPGRFEAVSTLDCPSCGGRWLDHADVRTVIGAMTTFTSAGPTGRRELRPRRLWSSAAPAPTRRPCPRCREPMTRHAATSSGPVWIDECPSRHGIWLDRGELETLAEFAREGGLARHLAAHAEHVAHPGLLGDWNSHGQAGAHATGFHWWLYLE